MGPVPSNMDCQYNSGHNRTIDHDSKNKQDKISHLQGFVVLSSRCVGQVWLSVLGMDVNWTTPSLLLQGKKKNPWSDSEESNLDISGSDMEQDNSFDALSIPRETGPRRAAGGGFLLRLKITVFCL